MRLQPRFDVGKNTVAFRLVEHLVVKALADDELLVGGRDRFAEQPRAGRSDRFVRAPLHDQEGQRNPSRLGPDALHLLEHLHAQPRRDFPLAHSRSARYASTTAGLRLTPSASSGTSPTRGRRAESTRPTKITTTGMLPGALTAGPGSPGAALYQRSGDNRG